MFSALVFSFSLFKLNYQTRVCVCARYVDIRTHIHHTIGRYAIITVCIVGSCATMRPEIRVGILHSQTGSLAISEKPIIDATQLAI